MKKCIYKSRLKKILISLILIIMMFQIMMPILSFAASETKTYEEWEESLKGNLNSKNRFYDGVKGYLESYIFNWVTDINVRNEKIEEFLGQRKKYLSIKGEATNAGYGFRVDEISDSKLGNKEAIRNYVLNNSNTYTYEEFKKFTGKSNQEINKEIISKIKDIYINNGYWITSSSDKQKEKGAESILNKYKDVMKISVEGTKNNYKITGLEIPGIDKYTISQEAKEDTLGIENSEEQADLGGILLSPIFYLVNFVADAIVSNLQRIMTGEGSISGIDVLVSSVSEIEYKATKTDEFKVKNMPNVIGTVQYPNIKYTPEEIFSGEIDLLSIDFISGKSGKTTTDADGNVIYKENSNSDWLSIRTVISQWYKVLRMIAIIGLLSVLIYTGIKIIISSNAKDKAKYKEWIINWFMAVAILFSMHYIMSFVISVTGEISKLLGDASQGIRVVRSGGSSFDSFTTNLMGLVRFMIQSEDFGMKIGYEVMYIALIVYTLKFTVVYLKRVLNMAFLTLIAPIVALTYPIDKINDGQAQGFNMWLKEYIFNALLQPMHYIMYYILVGSAVSIAASNPIYGIVVLAFMTEAEKLLKKIFGFDKASGGTVGGMTGAFAAGALASQIGKLARGVAGGNSKKVGPGGSNPPSGYLDNPKPTEKNDDDDNLFDDPPQEGGSSQSDNYTDDEQDEMLEEQTGLEGDELEAYKDKIGYGSNYTDDEQDEMMEMLREQNGLEDEQSNQEGLHGNNPIDNSSNESNNQTDDGSDSNNNNQQPPIQEVAKKKEESRQEEAKKKEKSKYARGLTAVRKRLTKPLWDSEKSFKYNAKTWRRRLGKAAIGFGIGTAAAAVQAGISITDGKYNPMEGIGTFTAGYAGGGQVVNAFGSLMDTYKEGTLPDDPKARKEEIMKRAQERFPDRDDVIKHNKKYKEEERKDIVKVQQQLLAQGITDLKEMDSCIKYMKQENGGEIKGVSSDMIKKSRIMNDFESNLRGQGMQKAIYDPSARKKYIDSVAKNDKEKRILENKFKEVIKYQKANEN